jgi:DNA-binding response OmpR family regulator
VVVVADRSADAVVLAMTLEAVACEVVTTAVSPAAVDLIQLVQPDVVVIVGGAVGWETVPKAIGDRAGWRKPFVVALTAPGQAERPVDGLHLAFDRPVSPDLLSGLVKRFRALLAGIDGFDPVI